MSMMRDDSLKLDLLTNHLSDRMKRLCREVLTRFPSDWDDHRTFDIEESDDRPSPSPGTIGYACARRYEDTESRRDELPLDIEPEQCWSVILYVEHLSLLSDQAIRWAIAHELGHVASGLRLGSLLIGGIPMTQVGPGSYEPAPPKDRHEDEADRLALEWGFSEEFQRFLSETGT